MKIQGTNSWAILDASKYSKIPKGNAGSNLKPYVKEESVSMSISEAGYENYRKNISEMGKGNTQSFEDVVKLKNSIPKNVTIDIEGVHNYNMLTETRELNQTEKEKLKESKETWTLEKGANNRLKAYARMYDEIVKGYADGTREIWIWDPSNGESGDYRRLTLEEDLEALDKAYENQTQQSVTMANMKEKAYKIVAENQKKVASAKGTKAEDTPSPIERLPSNALEKMMAAVEAFKNRYKEIGGDNGAWNEILSKVLIRF